MLKSTYQPISREQFTMLREARRLVKQELDCELSLQSKSVVHDLYNFAVRSKANELFDLFTQLHGTFEETVEHRLNIEQFVLLREARELVKREFDEDFDLSSAEVMSTLYRLAIRSHAEDLFDIYTFLMTRPNALDRLPAMEDEGIVGAQFIKLRAARQMIKDQFNEIVTIESDTIMDTLYQYALRAEEGELFDTIDELQAWKPGLPPGSDIHFAALTPNEFDQLREAKRQIAEEFDEVFSLHSTAALDHLYEFALRSENETLFDLFTGLCSSQDLARRQKKSKHKWLSAEQFMLFRTARTAVRSEFDELLDLASASVSDELYQYALRSEGEQLFDICSQLHALRSQADGSSAQGAGDLLSKEHFLMLRQARTLIKSEFAEELNLQSNVVNSELYRFAVLSESDDLFDLHTALNNLYQTGETESTGLSKEEFVVLREARRLIKTEFSQELVLDSDDVLDRLYEFSLDSEGEELFDLHAQLSEQIQAVVSNLDEVELPEKIESEEIESEVIEPEVIESEVIEPEVIEPESIEPEEIAPVVAEKQKPLHRLTALFGRSKTVNEDLTGVDDDGPTLISHQEEQKPEIARVETPVQVPEILVAETSPVETQDDAIEPAREVPAHSFFLPKRTHEKQTYEKNAERKQFGGFIERAMIKQAESQQVGGGQLGHGGASISGRKGFGANADDEAAPVLEDQVDDDYAVNASVKMKAPKRTPSANRRRKRSQRKRAAGDTQNAILEMPKARVEEANEAKSWYVGSHDGRLGVRVAKKLNIGMLDGELLIGAPDGDALRAVINIVENRPILAVSDDEVFVNDNLATGPVELAPGDKVRITDSVLLVSLA